MKEVNIFYSKIGDKPMDKDSNLYKSLPKNLVEKSKKYINWQDQDLNIIGKILLIEGLKLYNLDVKSLEGLKYTKYGKPYFLNLDIDFNISHSGKYAICVLAKGMKLGVDIEEIKKTDLSSFSEVFNENEFYDINSSDNREKTFYNYWTIKESVVKTIGKGLTIPLKEVKVETLTQAVYHKKVWHIHNLEIDDRYSSCIATDRKNVKLNYYQKNFHSE